MSVELTYFVHGTTTDNEKDISSGWYDVELSELGRKQSEDLKGLVDIRQFDVVFCSDLRRATESARITFGDVVPIIADARLRECNSGDYNAKPSDIVEPLQEKAITEPFPHGESYEDVKARVGDFIQMLLSQYDGKYIAIVAHKAPQIALDVLLKGQTWEEAFENDWRQTKSWKPGWEYTASH